MVWDEQRSRSAQLRIAFITPEFVTEYRNGGGLGNYVHRMGKLLLALGHEPEIFVSSCRQPQIVTHDGIRVQRVPPVPKGVGCSVLRTAACALGLSTAFTFYLRSRALAVATERRHRQEPFDIIQSSDYLAVGLCIRKRKDRIHLVRCSTAADLYNKADGCNSRETRWRERLERMTLRRAHCAYAPSALIANHFRTRHRIPVNVLRPPVPMDLTASAAPCGLPERFLIYFGQFARRKGTHWLSESFKQACEIDPTIRMVWVGRDFNNDVELILRILDRHSPKVQLRHPLTRPELFAVLQRAEAAVIPSLVDNLPNTVVESLTLGIPVIGTRGASIDELVENGVTGELVPESDVEGLASAMIRVWQGLSSARKGFTWRGGIVEQMQPEKAAENFLKLAFNGAANGADGQQVVNHA